MKLRDIFKRRKVKTDGLFIKCEKCSEMLYKKKLEENFMVCPSCNYHFTIGAKQRIEYTLDKDSFSELWGDMISDDPIKFQGPSPYYEKLKEAYEKTKLKEACICGTGKINNIEVVIGITDSRFLMGSMGSVLGEKITKTIEYGIENNLPIIIVSGSGGGARMYEGIISLMQMAKTSCAISKLKDKKIPFISILTHPTMAGVMASFASLADILIAEPGALIGFTGPRVIKQTIKKELPPGFQRSEFLLEHGHIDMIVHRRNMKETVAKLLSYLL